jgi:hypothetical protein
MARPAVDRQKRLRKKVESSPELLTVARQLAALTLTHQERPLSPRERESLRRGLASAGDALAWSETLATTPDPVMEFALDVMSLATIGVESLGSDLVEERANKQTEISRLGEVAEYTRRLATDPNATFPAEITYSYTLRDAYQGLVTKIAKSTVSNPQEALGAAEALQKSIEGRSKLTDLMVIDLEERAARLQAMAGRVPDFVKSSQSVLDEVIATLS